MFIRERFSEIIRIHEYEYTNTVFYIATYCEKYNFGTGKPFGFQYQQHNNIIVLDKLALNKLNCPRV